MAPAKRRAGGAKPAGKAPPHSLVTFAVNQGVDIEHARAQLNAFAEKYGAMMDTTAREALKHITADGLGPEYVEHCVATSSLREIRESQSQRSDGDRPAEGSPPPSRQGIPPRGVPRSRRVPRSRPTLPRPPTRTQTQSPSASSRGTSVAAPKRPPTDSPRLPAPHPAAPANPPAEPSSPSPSRNPNPIQIRPLRRGTLRRRGRGRRIRLLRREGRRGGRGRRRGRVRLLPGGRRGRVRRGDRTRPLRRRRRR